MSYKSQRSKATAIPRDVKEKVWERDGKRCFFCKSPRANPEAHIVSRANGGLGIEENILTVCRTCHGLLDQSSARQSMLEEANTYLDYIYGERDVKYEK